MPDQPEPVRWNPADPGKLAQLCADVRELRAQLDGLKELMDERNKRYEQGFREAKEAVSAALAAVKEQTKASFDASEKAITKAESAQNAYNSAHNDLLRKQDLLVPRIELDNRLQAQDERVADLRKVVEDMRKTQNLGEGQHGGFASAGDIVGRSISILVALAAIVIALLKH